MTLADAIRLVAEEKKARNNYRHSFAMAEAEEIVRALIALGAAQAGGQMMGGMKDSFYGDTPYPAAPGWKERDGGTSRAAARFMGNTAESLRAAVLSAIVASPDGLTADEVAARLGRSPLAIRPRVTELGEQRRIFKSGRKRPSSTTRPSAVWIDAARRENPI